MDPATAVTGAEGAFDGAAAAAFTTGAAAAVTGVALGVAAGVAAVDIDIFLNLQLALKLLKTRRADIMTITADNNQDE